MQTAGRIIDCCLEGQGKLTIQTQLLYYHSLFFNSTQKVKKKKKKVSYFNFYFIC